MRKKFNPYKRGMFLVDGKPTLIKPYDRRTDRKDGEPIPAPKSSKAPTSKRKETGDDA